MRIILFRIAGFIYRNIIKRILFFYDPEKIHLRALALGKKLGHSETARFVLKKILQNDHYSLSQTFYGVTFKNPIGLAAGFDYKASLPEILDSIGFGFGTIGTITNCFYEGNSIPRLGRLPRSKSLMVNKGFKNEGIDVILSRVTEMQISVPIGISIGKTNCIEEMTRQQSIIDIVTAFQKTEQIRVPFSYYELNISCPNLHGTIEFYTPNNLCELLTAVTSLNLSKPLFIKMPIDKSDDEIRAMLDIIVNFSVQGIIIGNLQKNRCDPALIPKEVARFSVGNFSGKPTWNRSNELISMAYCEYGNKLIIIGCGGIFSTEDAYEKIKRGASLVQLITGLIYEGPILPARISSELPILLKRDGFSFISEAIGAFFK